MLLAIASLSACAADASPTKDEGDERLGTKSSALLPSFPSGSVFAQLAPSPGYPEGIVIVGDDVFVTGPATFGTAGLPASQVLVFDKSTGAAKPSIPIAGEDTSVEHALSCVASDASGRLYVLSTQLGVVRLSPSASGWVQDIYSPALPDLPSCRLFGPTPCAPTLFEAGPLANDLAFDAAGNLYITDSYQATIYKVPPGGGAPQIWFQSGLFEGVPTQIGLNGLRVSPDQSKIFVTVTLPLASPLNGTLYSIPLVTSPKACDLRLEHVFGVLDGPDGIAFGANGDLFVSLAGTNSIGVLGPNKFEKTRFLGPKGSAIPFDGPANIAFEGNGSILVTNHATLSKNTAHFAVLEVAAGDDGAPLFEPTLP
jgi:sugar lactone lactonase YvrE